MNYLELNKLNRSHALVFILLVILPLFSFLPITKVSAITLTYPTLNIYTNQDESFSNPEFYFQIGNTESSNITVRPVVEVMYLPNWEDQFTITFDKPNLTLGSGESGRFYPTVYNNASFGFVYDLHFVFEALAIGNNNVIIASVGATVAHRVYSDLNGLRLRLKTTDQADRQIRTSINILYGGTGEVGQNWNSVAKVTTSFYENVLLEGWYKILAVEPILDITKEQIFYLEENMDLSIIFALLAFDSFQVFIPRFSNETGRITYTLSNNYQILSNVFIHFYVKVGNESLIYNSTSIRPTLEKGIYQDTLYINTTWYSDTYFFSGEVWVSGKLFIRQNKTISPVFPDNPYKYGEIPETNSNDSLIFWIFAPIGLGLLGIAMFRHEIRAKYKQYKLQKNELSKKLNE